MSDADPPPIVQPSGPASSEARAPEMALLSFFLGTRRYAVELTRAREILRWRRPTPLPGVPPFIEGVISVRGAVLPVIDLWCRLGLPPSPPSPQHRYVVVATAEGERAALRAERILGVLRLSADDLTPPQTPEALVRAVAAGAELTRVLDTDAVLAWRG